MRSNCFVAQILALTAAVGVASCGGQQKPAPEPEPGPVAPEPPKPEPPKPTIADDVVAPDGEPLRLPIEGTRPAWLQSPVVDPVMPEFVRTYSGLGTAVAATKQGQYVAFHDGIGVIGLVEPPANTVWLGFGKKDQLFAADSAGALHAATSLTKWVKRGEAPGATLWDAVPGVMAASDGSKVWVSVDGGKSFGKPFKPKAKVRNVFVRTPSTVVVEMTSKKGTGIYVSANAGKRFKRARLQPKSLTKDGGWIWSRDYRCPAVLAADNKTWVEPTEKQIEAVNDTTSWGAFTSLTGFVSGTNSDAKRLTHRFPRPPAVKSAKRKVRGADPCPDKTGDSGDPGVEGGVAGGSMMRDACEGPRCLRNRSRLDLPSKRVVTTFSDAKCRGDRCRDKAPLRLPHAALLDLEAGSIVSVGELPGECKRPRLIWSYFGISLLGCGDDNDLSIWATTDGIEWSREHSAQIAARDLLYVHAAADGTLVLPHQCSQEATSCSASVRRPVAVGTSGAWFEHVEKGGLTFRPVVGGRVLSVFHEGDNVILSIATSSERVTITEPIKAPKGEWDAVDIIEGAVEFTIGDKSANPTADGKLVWTR